MPLQPDSSVGKFENNNGAPGAAPGEADAADEEAGEVYSEDDSAGEPALMLTQAQADAAGMSGAMPGDTFNVQLTVATQADDGWNVQIVPGSAIKEPGVSEEPQEMPSARKGNASVKGPGDFGMPTDLGVSPSVLNT